MTKSVLVGISGGVDSAVAAVILKERGYRVEGLYLRNGFPLVSEQNAAAIADRLGFPFHVLDISNPFRKDIVDYFAKEYLAGRTPNPCIVCNKKVKFRYLINEADRLGLDYIATGHYARVEMGKEGFRLLKGVDGTKDQTYFLFQLGQEELGRLIFPNGDRTKAQIRKIGKHLAIPSGKESQEICFIPDDNYRGFLESYPVTLPPPGNIVDTAGAVVGRHQGTHTVTIGQRKGLNIASSRPYYVLEINRGRNEVIVGRDEDQLSHGLMAANCSWISGTVSDRSFNARAYIRYRHRGVEAEITPLTGERVQVRFETPQKAIAPGQAVVFFEGDSLLGGGWIEGRFRDV